MIVVSMTSWAKRISSVKKVVDSILQNTVTPDRIYLNLSSDEFKNKEADLPADLVEMFNGDERLILNWVDGENTKSMKKVFPILKYLEDDDFIIDADDDILFPSDLIESRIEDFFKYGGKFQITSNTHKSVNFADMLIVSATSLFQKKMLKNWELFVNDTIIHTYNDDRTYLYLVYMNGFHNAPCSKHSIFELLDKYDMHLKGGMGENKIHLIGGRYDRVALYVTGRNNTLELFDIFRRMKLN